MAAKSRHIPASWKEQIIKKQRGYCASKDCAKLHHGKKMKITMRSNFDHIKPLAMNGKHIQSNVQALCPGCHSAKTRADRAKIAEWKKKHPKSLIDEILKPPKLPKYKF